jgi:hypothetical protein
MSAIHPWNLPRGSVQPQATATACHNSNLAFETENVLKVLELDILFSTSHVGGSVQIAYKALYLFRRCMFTARGQDRRVLSI